MIIRDQRDFWSGAMFAAIGLAFLVLSQQYRIGSAVDIGPGLFPSLLGSLLTVLGLVIIWGSSSRNSAQVRVDRVGWRELLLIILSIVVFAAALPRLGMVISVALLISISASANYEVHLKETIVSTAVLLTLSWLVFVKGLELQFPIWPTFFVN